MNIKSTSETKRHQIYKKLANPCVSLGKQPVDAAGNQNRSSSFWWKVDMLVFCHWTYCIEECSEIFSLDGPFSVEHLLPTFSCPIVFRRNCQFGRELMVPHCMLLLFSKCANSLIHVHSLYLNTSFSLCWQLQAQGLSKLYFLKEENREMLD